MVIVSTKIKKSAREAFKPETIETDEFTVKKPEGFLHPLRDKPEFPYEAYSKTYGEKTTRNIWQARTRLQIFEDTTLKRIFEEIEQRNETIDSKKKLDNVQQGQNGLIIQSQKTEDEVDYKILRKIIEVETSCKIYELKTTILELYADEYTESVCETMRSFIVK